MLLKAEMTQTAIPGLPSAGTVDLYITFSHLTVDEDSQSAAVTIHSYARDPRSYPDDAEVPHKVFPRQYSVTNWTAIDNAMSAGASMWALVQNYIEGRTSQLTQERPSLISKRR